MKLIIIAQILWLFAKSTVSVDVIQKTSNHQNDISFCFDQYTALDGFDLMKSEAAIIFKDTTYPLICSNMVWPYTWYRYDRNCYTRRVCRDNDCDCVIAKAEVSDAGLYYCRNGSHAMFFELGVIDYIKCLGDDVNIGFSGNWIPAIEAADDKVYLNFSTENYDGYLKDLTSDMIIKTKC